MTDADSILPVVGYEGLYSVTQDGRVWSHRNRLWLKPRSNLGYLRVGLQSNGTVRSVYVHRVVAQAWIENPDNLPQVNHVNGVKADNRIGNLEWVNPRMNADHALASGLWKTEKRLSAWRKNIQIAWAKPRTLAQRESSRKNLEEWKERQRREKNGC